MPFYPQLRNERKRTEWDGSITKRNLTNKWRNLMGFAKHSPLFVCYFAVITRSALQFSMKKSLCF